MRLAVGMLVLALSLAACGSEEPEPLDLNGSSERNTQAGTKDGIADMACGEFHQMAVDFTDGLLTRSEMREAVKSIHDHSKGSPVENEARKMLAEITSGTPQTYERAVSKMSSACDRYRS